jgi:hypothetical protein
MCAQSRTSNNRLFTYPSISVGSSYFPATFWYRNEVSVFGHQNLYVISGIDSPEVCFVCHICQHLRNSQDLTGTCMRTVGGRIRWPRDSRMTRKPTTVERIESNGRARRVVIILTTSLLARPPGLNVVALPTLLAGWHASSDMHVMPAYSAPGGRPRHASVALSCCRICGRPATTGTPLLPRSAVAAHRAAAFAP